MRSTPYAVTVAGRIIGPFDGPTEARRFAARLRQAGHTARAERIWSPSDVAVTVDGTGYVARGPVAYRFDSPLDFDHTCQPGCPCPSGQRLDTDTPTR